MPVAEADLFQITEELWTAMLGLPLEQVGTSTTDEDISSSDSKRLTGIIHLNGAWEGAVAIVCEASLVHKVTAIMFGLADDELTDQEIRDALGEVTNMIAGNVKNLVPQPSRISLPSVFRGSDYRLLVPDATILSVLHMKSGDEPIYITLLEK